VTDVDKPAFLQAFTRLAVALREKDPDVLMMRVYFDALQDIEIELLLLAAERLMTTAEWFPKVSEWRAAARQGEAERVELQRILLRKRAAPLCPTCGDTGWADGAEGRVRPCPCRDERRLEVLGRRPWPALPPPTDGGSGT
jgi:tRNA(Ile2) C34 agmatinyltransferase TiaS